MVKLLIALGADVHLRDHAGLTPLAAACSGFGRDHSIVRLLLRAGADIDQTMVNGKTALMCAAEWGDTDMIQLLIENGANVGARMNIGCRALDFVGKKSGSKFLCNLARDILRNAER
jgi:ankyrin repeat protein